MMGSRLRNLAVGCGLVVLGLSAQGCTTPDRARLVSEPRCTDSEFQVYFAEQSAEVSRAARRVVRSAAYQAKGCQVAAVDVVGLADFHGPAEPNLALSRQRAQAVADALVKAGLPAPQFHVAALGDKGAVTAEGQIEPLRRRADVYVRYTR